MKQDAFFGGFFYIATRRFTKFFENKKSVTNNKRKKRIFYVVQCRSLTVSSSQLPWGALQRGPWPTRNFASLGHSAFGPTNNWPVCSLVKLV